MKFKKLAAVTMTSVMAVSMLAGCGGSNTEGSSAAGSGSTDTTGESSASSDSTGGEAAGDGEQITLRFASWSLGTEEENNIERQIIAKYEELHPNINIEIATEMDTTKWVESLTTAAAGGTMPDVCFVADLPTAVANDWALDVTSYVENDEDWANIPTVLSESGKYGSGTYGIPTGMHLMGLYVNTDLFESKNQEPLSIGYTMDDFQQALENMSAPSEGIIAIKQAGGNIFEWYPFIKNPELGWFTYNDGAVALNSPEFIEGIKFCQSIYTNGYSFDSLTDEQKANFGTESDWDAFLAGKVAMCFDPTSNVGVYSDMASNVEFVGLPDGKTGIIPDYAFISKTTEHPQEAYDFLKFISFSKEGIMARMDLLDADPELTWNSLPANQDEEIMTRYFTDYEMAGVKEVYENMEGNAVVEAFKYTPGYTNARWEAPTGISTADADNATMAQVIDACVHGDLNIDDYAEQINTLANSSIQEVQTVIDAVTQ